MKKLTVMLAVHATCQKPPVSEDATSHLPPPPSSQPVPLRHRRLALRDIYGQSINSVHYTFPFQWGVYRQYVSRSLVYWSRFCGTWSVRGPRCKARSGTGATSASRNARRREVESYLWNYGKSHNPCDSFVSL